MQKNDLLRGRVAVGYSFIKTPGALKFMFFLLGLKESGDGRVARDSQELYNQFKDKQKAGGKVWTNFIKEHNRAIHERSRTIAADAGIHYMPGADWNELSGAAEFFRSDIKRLAEELSVRLGGIAVEYGQNSYQAQDNAEILYRALSAVSYLIDRNTISGQLLGAKLKRLYFIHTLMTNTFQPAVAVRRIMKDHEGQRTFTGRSDVVIDLRQFRDVYKRQSMPRSGSSV